MYKIAVIGAGQLGSRHLQGLKLSKLKSDIWVVDNNSNSLQIAQQRYEEGEVNSNQTIYYLQLIEQLPTELDLVVIATSSKPRLTILKSLLAKVKVTNIILEKFLFTGLTDYDEAEQLLQINHVNVWVNCPRRLFDFYVEIDSMIDKQKPLVMEYTDSNWGLCCNSIHMIDIFMMLSGEKTYTACFDGIIPQVKDSKRNGYIEFNGTVNVLTPNGSTLRLACVDDDTVQHQMTIINGSHHIIINEPEGFMSVDGNKQPVHIKYQSQLTGAVADEILLNGNCKLTTYFRKENNELAIICRSPFQVLCAIEYLRSNIIEDYTFYLLSFSNDDKSEEISANVLGLYNIDYIVCRYPKLKDYFPLLKSELCNKYNYILCGNFFDAGQRMMASIIGSNRAVITFLDDGNQTINAIKQKSYYVTFDSVTNTLRSLFSGFLFIKKKCLLNNFFTFFEYEDLRVNIKKNDFSHVLINRNKINEKDGIYIIGTNSRSLNHFLDEKNSVELHLTRLISYLKNKYPNQFIYYCPHRMDLNNKELNSLMKENGISIMSTSFPVELNFLINDITPFMVVGFYSMAMNTLYRLYPQAYFFNIKLAFCDKKMKRQYQQIEENMELNGIKSLYLQ